MNFIDILGQYIDAAYPIVAVQTHEEQRLLDDLKNGIEGVDGIWHWSSVSGWLPLQGKALDVQPIKTENFAKALEAVKLQFRDNSLYVLKDAHPFVGQAGATRMIRDFLPFFKSKRRTLMLVGPVMPIPVELDKEIVVIEYELPDKDALGRVLDKVVADAEKTNETKIQVTERPAICEAGKGLTHAEMESALSLALIRHGDLKAEAVRTVRNEKAGAVKKSNLMTWVEPTVDVSQIGGLDVVKRDMKMIAPVFHDPEGALKFGLRPEDFPRSIAFVGWAGTGKSMAAEAIARLLNIGCVRTDFGSIFGSKVGESEANILARNKLVEAQAPIEDWWDEAEKGLAGAKGSDGNPWEARVGGSILTWMETYRRPILVVATINKHEALAPEMLSRFQRVYFVDIPIEAERFEIFNVHLGLRGIEIPKADVSELAADFTAGFNGREIRNLIQSALQSAFAQKAKAVTAEHLREAAGMITPVAVLRKGELQAMREWADQNNVQRASSSGKAQEVGEGEGRRLKLGKGGKR